jgi:hypothetical protein
MHIIFPIARERNRKCEFLRLNVWCPVSEIIWISTLEEFRWIYGVSLVNGVKVSCLQGEHIVWFGIETKKVIEGEMGRTIEKYMERLMIPFLLILHDNLRRKGIPERTSTGMIIVYLRRAGQPKSQWKYDL